MALFEVGRVYSRRKDLHRPFGGQEQGGISTPADHPLMFLFTGESGEAHGYNDSFDEESGSFMYFGEGQVGDMEMVRGNAAIRDHQSNGKGMHLFAEHGSGTYRYLGDATYLNHFERTALDREGEPRRAFVFELEIDDPGYSSPRLQVSEPKRPAYASMTFEELRELATAQASADVEPKERKALVRYRSEAVRQYVLRRAGGVCEGCGRPAPFLNTKGKPYLEPHHLRRLQDGGPDDPQWVIGLCPTCHRRVHYGQDGEKYNEELLVKIRKLEP